MTRTHAFADRLLRTPEVHCNIAHSDTHNSLPTMTLSCLEDTIILLTLSVSLLYLVRFSSAVESSVSQSTRSRPFSRCPIHEHSSLPDVNLEYSQGESQEFNSEAIYSCVFLSNRRRTCVCGSTSIEYIFNNIILPVCIVTKMQSRAGLL